MRRTSTTVVLATAAALLVASPAFAATTVVVSSSGIPSPWVAFKDDCNDFQSGISGTASYAHVSGPAGTTPPSGTGSLRFRTGTAESDIDFERDFASPEPAATTLTALSVDAFVPDGFNPYAYLAVILDTGTAGDFHVGFLFFDSSTDFVPYNAMTATLVWQHVHDNISDPPTQSTYSAYTTAHSGLTLGSVGVGLGNCGSGVADRRAYVDNLLLTDSTEDELVDFEGATSGVAASAFTIHAAKAIVAGKGVKVTGTLTDSSGPIGSQHAQLWAKPAGGSAHKIATVTTNENGVASSTQHPKVNTTYQWRFPGDDASAASNSSSRTVGVARKLTLHVADTTLQAAQKLKAAGTESPAKAGSTLTVWRHNSGGTHKVGTATVHSNGSWSLSADVPKGSYKVYATSPKDSKNLAGKSPSTGVTSK